MCRYRNANSKYAPLMRRLLHDYLIETKKTPAVREVGDLRLWDVQPEGHWSWGTHSRHPIHNCSLTYATLCGKGMKTGHGDLTASYQTCSSADADFA